MSWTTCLTVCKPPSWRSNVSAYCLAALVHCAAMGPRRRTPCGCYAGCHSSAMLWPKPCHDMSGWQLPRRQAPVIVKDERSVPTCQNLLTLGYVGMYTRYGTNRLQNPGALRPGWMIPMLLDNKLPKPCPPKVCSPGAAGARHVQACIWPLAGSSGKNLFVWFYLIFMIHDFHCYSQPFLQNRAIHVQKRTHRGLLHDARLPSWWIAAPHLRWTTQARKRGFGFHAWELFHDAWSSLGVDRMPGGHTMPHVLLVL